jgi:hypothetical protein
MRIEVKGLDEIMTRMSAYPRQMTRAITKTLEAALLIIWESVPGYPPPPSLPSDRGGTLGRSLGVGMGGGKVGQPDIYEVKQDGGYQTARFGTRLSYAPYVVGDPASEQARHMRHWWTLPKTVAWLAEKKVIQAFEVMGETMAAWLKGKEQ